jgi:hypothetical protein
VASGATAVQTAAASCGSLTSLTLANTVIDSAVDTPAGTAVVRTCRVASRQE